MDDWHAVLRKEMIAQPRVVPDLQDEVPYRDRALAECSWLA